MTWQSAADGVEAGTQRCEREIRFHDLRHTRITKSAESQNTAEYTIMAIAVHMGRKMLEHYGHIRMAAKRAALEGIVERGKTSTSHVDVNENVNQLSEDIASKSLN